MEPKVVLTKEQETEDKLARWLAGDGEVATYANGQLAHWAKRYLRNEAGHKCTKCGWSTPNPVLNKPILTIDHVDGNWLNNSYDNLKVLCFNCHTLTESFGSLNIGKSPRSRPGLPQKQREGFYVREIKVAVDNICGDENCNEVIGSRSKHCRKHAPSKSIRRTAIEWPSDEELVDALKRSNFFALGRELGVSDNSIRKRLRGRGYDLKTLKKLQEDQ